LGEMCWLFFPLALGAGVAVVIICLTPSTSRARLGVFKGAL